MIIFGIGLGWVGYAVGFYGYCLVKGYDVAFKQVMSPFSFYTGKWPPPTAPDTVIIPTGAGGTGSTQTTGGNGGGKTSTSGSTGHTIPLPASGKCPPGSIRIGSKCIAPTRIQT